MRQLWNTNVPFCPWVKKTLICLFILLTGCTELSTSNQFEEKNDLTVDIVSSPIPTVNLSLTKQPVKDVAPYWLMTENGNVKLFPKLWTSIAPAKIQNYTFSLPIQSAVGGDGSTWYIGPFGIIWEKPDGSQILFSNDLPNSYGFPAGSNFRLITIGSDGQVWVGGRNKTLFRFNGKEWINEGDHIPNATGKPNWLCYDKQIVGIDFDLNGLTWILTAEMEIYYLENGIWNTFSNRIPDEFMPVAGGGACPQGMRVYSPNNIVIKRSGCCEAPDIGIVFDGKTWKKTDEPEDVIMMYQWQDYFVINKKIEDRVYIFLMIYKKDKTTHIEPFFSWLAPPHGTYTTETEGKIIYITNQNLVDNEILIASFDKKTQNWQSFLFRDFNKDQLCSAYVDDEGYIWIQFNCFKHDLDGVLLPLQDTLYRLSPDVFDDY